MLAKIWKRLFLIICIIAIIINIGHKLVSRTSLKEQLIQLATTESLSTSINNFVKEKYGQLTDDEKKEFSNPIGEFVDAFGKDGESKNKVDDEANNEINNDNNNDDNKVNPVDAEGNPEAQNMDNENGEEAASDGENGGDSNNSSSEKKKNNQFTQFMQNMVDDFEDNAYLNDDPSDDLIDTTPTTIDL